MSASKLERDIQEYLRDPEAAKFVVETERRLREAAKRGGAYQDESGSYSQELYDAAQRAARIRADLNRTRKQVMQQRRRDRRSPGQAKAAGVAQRSIRVGDVLAAVRDSDSLGIDRGTTARVTRVGDGRMDLDVPSLDARIVGVIVDHPDLARKL